MTGISKIRRGFQWRHNSCSFDMVLTILPYFFMSLPVNLREEFKVATPSFGNTVSLACRNPSDGFFLLLYPQSSN